MIYRLSQGLRALFAWGAQVDFDAAADILTPDLMGLFRRMRRSEQLHSLRVAEALRAQGHDNPDLLVAALLHDCGKSRWAYSLTDRTLATLVRAAAPRLFERWSAGDPAGWRRPFVIAACHPTWSAEDMAAAGASALAIRLARRHQEKLTSAPANEEDRLLAALQAVDDRH